MITEQVEILIIGAGPAGSVAAGLLRNQGRQVLMVEKQEFPRFAIGESLLPQSIEFLEAAGMLRDVVEAGFQHKNGAAFTCCGEYADFDFRDKTSEGWATAWQVERDDFDDVLADAAERAGAQVRFCHEVVAVDVSGDRPRAMVRSPDGESYAVEARFMLDASGSGRVLPRLLDLESPSGYEPCASLCTQVHDGIRSAARQPGDPEFDRNKILVELHPARADVWYWLIPLSRGRSSLGVVASPEFIDQHQAQAPVERLRSMLAQAPGIDRLLARAQYDSPVRRLAANPSQLEALCGRGFALLGNAGEFPDPVFCSGVTIALKSASLAADCIRREFEGEQVDWRAAYSAPLKAGIDVFRAYAEAWHSGAFIKIALHQQRQQPQVRRMISSVLAGYAWDDANPYAKDARRRLRALAQAGSQSSSAREAA